jgi:dihydroxy-acid dehydratase
MTSHRGRAEDITEAYYRGLMHAVGYRQKDLEKPQIAVVNSWTDVNPGHLPLKDLAQRVKEGIWSSGGAPGEFNVPAPCDGMAQGPGQHYILPQRDLIAASIEAMVKAHGFDGLVMLGSCDKIIPGMLMAAIRLNLPTIFLTAGAMLPCRIEGRTVVTSDLKEAIGKASRQDIDMPTFLNWQERYCASSGTCSMMGTANTMGCFLEAVGLAPFGSATMLTFDAAKHRQARDVGEQIVNLTRQERRVDSFLNKAGLENGIKFISASGGSTNAILHLMACARLMNLKLDLRQFEALQSSVPVLAKFKPSSSFNITDFHQAGGVLEAAGPSGTRYADRLS